MSRIYLMIGYNKKRRPADQQGELYSNVNQIPMLSSTSKPEASGIYLLQL